MNPVGALTWLKKWHLIGPAILLGALVLAMLIVVTGPSSVPEVREEKAWPVSVITASPATLSPTLVAFGRVESQQVANLKTSVSAPVDAVLTPEGTWVEEGELLIRLEARELNLAVKRAESEYQRRLAVLTAVRNDFKAAQGMTAHHRELARIAAAKLARHEELYATRMISSAIVDEARQQASERAIVLQNHEAQLANFPSLVAQHEALVAEAEAVLETARLDLLQTEVRAPFAGRVIAVQVSPGDRVLPGSPLIEVADFSRLEVRTAIPSALGEKLRSRIAGGAQVTALGGFDGQAVELSLVRFAGNIKAGQSGLDVLFAPEEGQQLELGRVLNLEIHLPPEPDVIELPIQAIYDNTRIYKVVDERLVGVPIERVGDHLGHDGEFNVLVRSPAVAPGDTLVTTQLPRAITGLLVRPLDANPFDGVLAADTPTSKDAKIPQS